MTPFPKPIRAPKAPKPLRRSAPLPRSPMRATRSKRVRFGNAYTQPEWKALCRQVKTRSRGWCELRICCDGDKAVGDPHHLSVQPGMRNKRRVLVPLDQLVATCRRCHLAAHGHPAGLFA